MPRQPPGAVAAGPLAPVMAQALTGAAVRNATGGRTELTEFIDGLPQQRSLLALAATVDELLAWPPVVEAHGGQLHDALLRDLGPLVDSHPLIAASRLEGALRLAIADAVAPFAVLGRLTGDAAGRPEEFTEALPRLVGAAMDRWAGEPGITAPLRDALDRLRHEDSAAVDAAYELGCDELRTALTATEMTTALEALNAARSRFATVDSAEQSRHDARAHAAACDAILAFAAQHRGRLADAADRLTAALDQRSAWSHGTHRPSWLRARHTAESTWRRLVSLLRAAADRLAETIWMDVWEALGAVLDAYTQARSVRPLPGARHAPGLAAVVEPTIENAIVRSHTRLAALRRTVLEASATENPRVPPRTAHLLLDRIERTPTGGGPGFPEPGSSPEAEDRAATSRAHRLAPALVRVLGERHASGLSADLCDEDLLLLDGVVHSSEITRSRTAHPVLDPLLETLLEQLADSPEFTGDVRATFGLLLEQTLRFLLSRADLTSATWGWKDADYRRALRERDRRPRESDLQRDYHQWLVTGQLGGLVSVEATDVAMGRADVTTTFGSVRYVTEVKRELRDSSRSGIEAAHLAQAAEYGCANVPFGQLLVLDLTAHGRGSARVDELVWLARHPAPRGGADRFVIVGVVTGNRSTPHEL
ncbi:hypothetical protein [Saccharopolyspora tripterygii]